MVVRADEKMNALYEGLRGPHGEVSPKANGYRNDAQFRRERAMVVAALGEPCGVVVDVASGSGLMAQPIAEAGHPVLCVDFNEDACRAARNNGMRIVRGDAFQLPLEPASVSRIINCSFFNQQTPEAVERFVAECGRCLEPGGRAVLVWRNGRAWVHRVAHAVFSVLDRVRGLPTFPHEEHSLGTVAEAARRAGLDVSSSEVTFAAIGWRTRRTDGWMAKVLGASCFLVLSKAES